MKELKTGDIKITAGDLQEVRDVAGDDVSPWLDEEEEPYPMSEYSQKIEAKLRELLQEIQMDRLKEPDATTWLYHLSATIENVKMDLAN